MTGTKVYNFSRGGMTAKMVASYIDYIIRNNPDDFKKIGFVGSPYEEINLK